MAKREEVEEEVKVLRRRFREVADDDGMVRTEDLPSFLAASGVVLPPPSAASLLSSLSPSSPVPFSSLLAALPQGWSTKGGDSTVRKALGDVEDRGKGFVRIERVEGVLSGIGHGSTASGIAALLPTVYFPYSSVPYLASVCASLDKSTTGFLPVSLAGEAVRMSVERMTAGEVEEMVEGEGRYARIEDVVAAVEGGREGEGVGTGSGGGEDWEEEEEEDDGEE